MIETKEIKLDPNKMLSILFFLYGKVWLLIAFSGIVIFIILGFSIDFKFFILSLIWIFLIIPIVVAYLYFFFGLKSLTVLNTLSHRIRFKNEYCEILINNKMEIFTEGEAVGDLKENEKLRQNKDFQKKEEKILTGIKEYEVDFKEFENIRTWDNCLILLSKDRGWLWVPFHAFESISEFINVRDNLFNNICNDK